MKDKPIHEILGTHLLNTLPERQEELLALMTWQSVLAEALFRKLRSTSILSGVLGLLGVILCWVLSRLS